MFVLSLVQRSILHGRVMESCDICPSQWADFCQYWDVSFPFYGWRDNSYFAFINHFDAVNKVDWWADTPWFPNLSLIDCWARLTSNVPDSKYHCTPWHYPRETRQTYWLSCKVHPRQVCLLLYNGEFSVLKQTIFGVFSRMTSKVSVNVGSQDVVLRTGLISWCSRTRSFAVGTERRLTGYQNPCMVNIAILQV